MVKKRKPQEIIDAVLAGEQGIDEALEEIEQRMRGFQALADAKTQLLAARRALLGHGSRTTGGTTTQVTSDDLYAYVGANPGLTPGQIAEHFGVKQGTISSHFYRAKTRYIEKEGRYWARDPKNGLDTADDIEEDED